MRDVGEMGERALQMWSADVGVSANKVEIDKTGWDFLLEFPLSHGSDSEQGVGLDLDPRPIQCFVQVKSSDDNKRSWSVKLDNWARLVKTPLPSFFLVLQFDKRSDCQRVFLVHIGEEYIRMVLKRLREMTKNQRSKLHTHRLPFKYSDKELLSATNGNALKNAIERYVGDIENYIKWKQELLETVGYEDGKNIVYFNIGLPSDTPIDIQEYLSDFSVGLVPHLQVIDGEVKDIRFGIEDPNPIQILGAGKLQIEKKSLGMSSIRLSAANSGAQLLIEMDTIVPQDIIPGINATNRKVRLHSQFIDIILSEKSLTKNELTISCRMPKFNQSYDLQVLVQMPSFFLFVHQAKLDDDEVLLEVFIPTDVIKLGNIFIDSNLEEDFIKYCKTVQSAWEVSRFFNLQQTITLRPSSLLNQSEQLVLMSLLINADNRPLKVSGNPDQDTLQVEDQFCVPIVIELIIGNYRLIFAGAILANVEKVGLDDNAKQFIGNVNKVISERKYIFKIEEKVQYTKSQLIEDIVKKYENKMHIMRILGSHN